MRVLRQCASEGARAEGADSCTYVYWIASLGTCTLCLILGLKGGKSMGSLLSGRSGRALKGNSDRMRCLSDSKNLLEGTATTEKGAAHSRHNLPLPVSTNSEPLSIPKKVQG